MRMGSSCGRRRNDGNPRVGTGGSWGGNNFKSPPLCELQIQAGVSFLRRSIGRQQVSLPILIELNMRQKKRRTEIL